VEYKRAACAMFNRTWTLDNEQGIVDASKIFFTSVPWLTAHG
jgi:hypothetical protein